ncbi:MAG: CopD family protein [Marinoscillum sp.]
MDYLNVKSLHIIFVITWFAGLFYVVRLFIYHTEALQKSEPDRSILSAQLGLMTRKLWYVISWPSAILTLTFGIWMLVLQPSWLSQPFMHIKLTFVACLAIYHLICHRIFKKLQNGETKFSSIQLRIWNEIATIILVAVVFLIVKKNTISWVRGTIGIVGFAVVLMLVVKIYKRLRERSK